MNITVFGGEPLLNFPLLQEVVCYAKEQAAKESKKVSFGITANGSLLTNEIISFFKDEKIHPLISFDGPPEIQNWQRPFKDGSGSHERVRANIEKLRAVIPNLTARATIYGDGDPVQIKAGMEAAGFTTCLMAKALPVLLPPTTATPSDEGVEQRREKLLHRMVALNQSEVE